jgi:uncharacterized protein YgiB involved in biofilm formation
MKRTRTLALTTLMATGGFTLSACGDSGPGVTIADPGKPVDAYAYQSLQECRDKNEVPDDACEKAETAALSDQDQAAKHGDQRSCEDVYGEGQCVPRSANGQGSFWGPLAAGFVVGRMLDGGFGGRGYYRDRDGGFVTGSGGRMSTNYATGRTQIGSRGFDPPSAINSPPPKMQSRSSVISRGGFGGRMSARSGGWGG